MTERDTTPPWVEDPDPPGDIQVMTHEEAQTFADNVAEAYPELVRLPVPPKRIARMTVAQWAKHFSEKDRALIDNAIRTGVLAGLDSTEIARKVIGSLELNGLDGATELTRQYILRLARVAIAPRKSK